MDEFVRLFPTIIVAIITAVTSSGFTSLIIFLIQRKDRMKEKEAEKYSAQSRMLLGLGHDKILFLTDKFVRRGAITLKEKRNLKYLYEPYHEAPPNGLGGNGDCEIGYDACMKLPIVSEEDALAMDCTLHRKEFGIETE